MKDYLDMDRKSNTLKKKMLMLTTKKAKSFWSKAAEEPEVEPKPENNKMLMLQRLQRNLGSYNVMVDTSAVHERRRVSHKKDMKSALALRSTIGKQAHVDRSTVKVN